MIEFEKTGQWGLAHG